MTPESAEILVLDHNIKQINGSTVSLTGSYQLKEDLDNTYTLHMIASLVTRGNSFFEVYRTKPQGICDISKQASASQKFNMVELPDCPITKSEGAVEDEVLNFEPALASMIPGKLKVEIVLAKDGAEKARCTMILVAK